MEQDRNEESLIRQVYEGWCSLDRDEDGYLVQSLISGQSKLAERLRIPLREIKRVTRFLRDKGLIENLGGMRTTAKWLVHPQEKLDELLAAESEVQVVEPKEDMTDEELLAALDEQIASLNKVRNDLVNVIEAEKKASQIRSEARQLLE